MKSKYVIIASHYPFINFPGFYFTKMYQSTSYLIAIDTKKTLFNGMYLSASSPVFSFRTAEYEGNESAQNPVWLVPQARQICGGAVLADGSSPLCGGGNNH